MFFVLLLLLVLLMEKKPSPTLFALVPSSLKSPTRPKEERRRIDIMLQISSLFNDQFLHRPILKAPIRQVPSNEKGNFSLSQFLHGNLQGICLPLVLHHDWGAHANIYFHKQQGERRNAAMSMISNERRCEEGWDEVR